MPKRKTVSKAKLKRDLKRVTEERNQYDNDLHIFREALIKAYKLCLSNEHNKILDTAVKAFAKAQPFNIY